MKANLKILNRGWKLLTMAVTFLLLIGTMGIPLGRVEIVYEASAAPTEPGTTGVYIDADLDFGRAIPHASFFKDDFVNETGLTDTWDVTSTTGVDFYLDEGYMYHIASSETHYARENMTLTDSSVFFEMMYMTPDKEVGDEAWLKIENITDKSYIKIGNDYNVFEVVYSNATGVATVANFGTFSEDVWYVVSITMNDDASVVCEARYKSNFTLVEGDSSRISITACNITAPSNVGALWVNTTGTTSNIYEYEYVFAVSGTAQGENPAEETTMFSYITPREEKNIWKAAATAKIDEGSMIDDLPSGGDHDFLNVTGNLNATTMIRNGGGGQDIDWATIEAMTDNRNDESVWDNSDFADGCSLYNETNTTGYGTSSSHREVRTWELAGSAGLDETLRDLIISQYIDDDGDSDYKVIDYRLDDANLVFDYSDNFKDAITDSFFDGVEAEDDGNSDIDYTAYWGESWIEGSGRTLTGDGNGFLDAIGAGLGNAKNDVVGIFGFSYDEAGDLMSSSTLGFGGGFKNAMTDGYVLTSGLIGSAVSGSSEFSMNMRQGLITNGVFGVNPLTVFFGGTLGLLKYVIVIVIIIVVLILCWRFKIWPLNGTLTNPFKHPSGQRKISSELSFLPKWL